GLRVELVDWYTPKKLYRVRSAGADKQFDTPDDLAGYLEVRSRKIVGQRSSGASKIDLNIEHDRGPYNGLAEMTGSVLDRQGGALEGAAFSARPLSGGATRT